MEKTGKSLIFRIYCAKILMIYSQSKKGKMSKTRKNRKKSFSIPQALIIYGQKERRLIKKNQWTWGIKKRARKPRKRAENKRGGKS